MSRPTSQGPDPCPRCDSPEHGSFAGPDLCPRYYKGPRNRRPDALRPLRCVGCAMCSALRKEGGRGTTTWTAAAQLLFTHGFDVDAAQGVARKWSLGSFTDAVLINLERARRNDLMWLPGEVSP